ncbi:MAG TPA: hypothetical protein VJ742_08515 [Nitrososphaera sp.]|nr:hypothetical protein [Nitrososphaera sp.]
MKEADKLRNKEMLLNVQQEKRSEQRVECQYCEVATKVVVTRLEGYQEKPYRGVPCGWD